MKCCICDGEIDKHYTPEGKMYWDQGHNPAPVKTGEDDRCCDNCNATVVIPARLVNQTGMAPAAASKLAAEIATTAASQPLDGLEGKDE